MVKNTKNVPEIRIIGFDDAWEQREFDDIVHRKSDTAQSCPALPGIEYEDINSGLGTLNKDPSSKSSSKKGVKFCSEDVLFGKLRPYLKNWYLASSEGVAIGDFWVMDSSVLKGNFLYYLIQTQKFQEIANTSVGTKMPRADWNLVSKSSFSIPLDKNEQDKIGQTFVSLDNLLTLHQREYDRLVNLKNALLQKMFPKEGETVPEMRFEGFTDAWEQRRLGDCLAIATRRNGTSYGKEDVLSVSDEYGCVNQIEFQGRSFAGNDVSNYKIVKAGDIIYTRSPLRAKPYGIIKVMRGKTGVVSPLYIVNEPTKGNDSEFIYRVFDTPARTNNYLSPLVRKGAKNTMNISEDEWLSGNIMISPSYDEQHQIGECFQALDSLLSLYQHKLKRLKHLKQAYLQKMFV